ncbi:F-box protein [Candidatus Arsenophonus triatominarum]|uniref:F-box protein n=1 Tax=Candidatus Arsenophonus triatominarum TaxID=57911 RepID=UPI0013967DE5|nr:F-box protein [Candidatus Arsenophonus triatominarum]
MNNSSHRLVSYSDSESTSSNNQNSPLANVTGIKNLPTELIENIAFRLTAKDYGNFRQASKDFASKLESVKSMAEDYYNNDFSFTCEGELRENKSKLVANSYGLYRCITAQASSQTLEALSDLKNIHYHYHHDNVALIRQRCYFMKNRHNAFIFLKRLDSVPISTRFILMIEVNDFYFSLQMLFNKDKDNREDIAAIFNKAHELFISDKTDKGLIIAAIMSSLYKYLSQLYAENKIAQFSDEVLASYRDSHRSMFLTGDCINDSPR